MPRTDLYAAVHKAIRAALFETTTGVARTDFADATESLAASVGLCRLFAWLDEHAAHEDAVVMPELQQLDPALFAVLEHEHQGLAALQQSMQGLLHGLDDAPAEERAKAGQRLQPLMHRLVAAHLEHMQREEVEANRVLWAHRSDTELQTLHARIMARIAPPRLGEWLQLIVPALSRPEQAQLLVGLQQKLPAAMFASLTEKARAAIGEPAFAAALTQAVA